MSNHIHLIVVPEQEASLAKAIGETHRLYTRKINFETGARGYLFQGRFFSCALDEAYFYNCLRYVEQNPVRAGICKNAWGYPHSSANMRVAMGLDSILAEHEWIPNVDEYKSFLNKYQKEEDINMIELRTKTGRPCGNDEFYEYIKAKFGKDMTPKKAGRPKKIKLNKKVKNENQKKTNKLRLGDKENTKK